MANRRGRKRAASRPKPEPNLAGVTPPMDDGPSLSDMLSELDERSGAALALETPLSNFRNVPRIGTDEPTLADELGRRRYATALANIAITCSTPQVIGVYGSWGTGKTSLLRQVQQIARRTAGVPTIWFDPWLHQFDESPVLALVQSTNIQLNIDTETTIRSLLRSLSVALVDSMAKMAGTLSVAELREHLDAMDAEQFRRRDVQVRIMDLFAEYISEARSALATNPQEKTRLLFFIDDLDRCVPDKVVALLEALKLYLSQPGCVYILGLDRAPVEAAIRHQYPWAENSKAAYLDKIIQLQFQLPPISPDAASDFVLRRIKSTFGTLNSGQRAAAELIAAAVGTNPRQIKRVIAAFALAEMLAQQGLAGENYESSILALTIIFQYHFPEIYDGLAEDPTRLSELVESSSDDESLYHRHVEGNRALLRILDIVRERLTGADLSPYIHLVEVAAQSGPGIEGRTRRVRIYELAEELGLTNEETLELCHSVGIGIRSHSSSIEEAQAERVRRKADSEGLRQAAVPVGRDGLA